MKCNEITVVQEEEALQDSAGVRLNLKSWNRVKG